MNSGGSNTNVNALNNECVRLQLFRCSFEKTVESLGKHFRLKDIEGELDKICPKGRSKRIYELMVQDMKIVLSDCISDNKESLNCNLKILEEVTREGVYDTQPKWRPSGDVEGQVAQHIIAEKLNLINQLERDLKKETTEVSRLKQKIAMRRKLFLKRQRKYSKLSKSHSSVYNSLESLAVLEADVLSKIKRKLNEVDK